MNYKAWLSFSLKTERGGGKCVISSFGGRRRWGFGLHRESEEDIRCRPERSRSYSPAGPMPSLVHCVLPPGLWMSAHPRTWIGNDTILALSPTGGSQRSRISSKGHTMSTETWYRGE